MESGLDLPERPVELTVISAMLLVMSLILVASWYCNSESTTTIFLRGEIVEQLSPGAPIVMDGIRIGSVQGVDREDGQTVARLKIRNGIEREIPPSSQYVVHSLNSVLPGNVGIEVINIKNDLSARGFSLREIEDSSEVFPTAILKKLYLVVGIVVIALAFVIGLALKIASDHEANTLCLYPWGNVINFAG